MSIRWGCVVVTSRRMELKFIQIWSQIPLPSYEALCLLYMDRGIYCWEGSANYLLWLTLVKGPGNHFLICKPGETGQLCNHILIFQTKAVCLEICSSFHIFTLHWILQLDHFHLHSVHAEFQYSGFFMPYKTVFGKDFYWNSGWHYWPIPVFMYLSLNFRTFKCWLNKGS